MEQVLTQADFADIKAICAGIGLVIFGGVFITAALWVYRPGASKHYQDLGKKILED